MNRTRRISKVKLSPKILKTIYLNNEAWLKGWGCQVDNLGTAKIVTNPDHPYYNGCYFISADRKNAPKIVDKVIALMRKKKVSKPSFWVEDFAIPSNLPEILASQGFVDSEAREYLFWRKAYTVKKSVSDLTIREVGPAEIDVWASTYSSGLQREKESTYDQKRWRRAIKKNPDLKFYLAVLDKKPVAVAQLECSYGLGGLYSLSVIPKRRGQRIGPAITVYVINEGIKHKCQGFYYFGDKKKEFLPGFNLVSTSIIYTLSQKTA